MEVKPEKMKVVSFRVLPQTHEDLIEVKNNHKKTWDELLNYFVKLEVENDEDRRNGKMD